MTIPTPVSRRRDKWDMTCLQLNLRLSNVLLTATTIDNLLCLSELASDGVGAEILQGVGLDGIDAQGRVGLDDGESSGHCDDTRFVSFHTPWLSEIARSVLDADSRGTVALRATYGRTACCCRSPRQSRPGRASAAQLRGRGWRGHPSLQTRRAD